MTLSNEDLIIITSNSILDLMTEPGLSDDDLKRLAQFYFDLQLEEND